MSVLRRRKPRTWKNRAALGRDAPRRRDLHVVAVHPRELLGVEHAGAVADVLEREAPRQLVHRHQLRIVGHLAAARARRPADEREVVGERLGQVAALAELATDVAPWRFDSGVWSGPSTSERCAKRGGAKPERAIEQHLPRRVRDVVLAADHMRDLHQRVVHDHREVVGGTAVGADQDRIADDVGAERDVAADEILERRRRGARARGSGRPRAPPPRPGAARRRAPAPRQVP